VKPGVDGTRDCGIQANYRECSWLCSDFFFSPAFKAFSVATIVVVLFAGQGVSGLGIITTEHLD
jgi:hypothetical protein